MPIVVQSEYQGEAAFNDYIRSNNSIISDIDHHENDENTDPGNNVSSRQYR